LSLQPGPGLTVVVGRNGSGKSSFAEALEVLLTGELRRWEKLSAVWRQGWRSMHKPEHAEITAEFLVQDAGPAVVQRTWPDGADFARSSVFAQVAGEKRAGLERLGCPSRLPATACSWHTASSRRSSAAPRTFMSCWPRSSAWSISLRRRPGWRGIQRSRQSKKSLSALLDLLQDVGDERAGACLEALGGRTWDLAAARRAATGVQVAADGGELDRLRRLAQLTAPAGDDARRRR
jgi:energy-coupling factor transporter ATP-binding protein EcfA2